MKIGIVSAEGRGETDRLISETAMSLVAQGAQLSGIVKVLDEVQPEGSHHCDMSVRVLPGEETIKITQSLGDGSEGCRLNPEAIVEAVAAVERSAKSKTDLFVLNKFGPQEAEGRGFRDAIAAALEQGIPVLVGVTQGTRAAFNSFTAELGQALAPDNKAIETWCQEAMSKA
ncbi:DUF2478 domain-containing protein [uncultured Shimia sp.]|uniref:DUF2478 domain-containing protein n=1 Tax=uncultured Shimia sp. TaxID=573152 RepID=UPI002616CE66|nr:DUF2478 domain-containing protein [uncultured Shimia sp.]